MQSTQQICVATLPLSSAVALARFIRQNAEELNQYASVRKGGPAITLVLDPEQNRLCFWRFDEEETMRTVKALEVTVQTEEGD